jgi:hypothetical protein
MPRKHEKKVGGEERGGGEMEEMGRGRHYMTTDYTDLERIKGCCERSIVEIREFLILTTDYTDKKDGTDGKMLYNKTKFLNIFLGAD